MSRQALIGQLIEEGYTPEEAIRYANKAYPKSKSKGTADKIVNNVLEPVEAVTEAAGFAVKAVLTPWKLM